MQLRFAVRDTRWRLAVLALVLSLSLWAGYQSTATDAPASVSAPQRAADGDVALYREIATRVSRGESYYTAARDLHRAHDYPLRPFYAVRPPTLAWAGSTFSPAALVAMAWVALLAGIATWYHRLRGRVPAERIAGVLALTLAGAPLISAVSVYMHELWCGLALTIALGLDRDRHWPAQLALAVAAVLMREFAAAFLALMLLAALVARDRRQATAVAAAIGAAILFYAGHREMVQAVVDGSDRASQGWLGLGGPIAFVRALAMFSGLGLLPERATCLVAFLPILGWATLRKDAVFALGWFLGFGTVICVFARPDNTYWIVVLLPAYLAGLAFVPGFFAQWWRQARMAGSSARELPGAPAMHPV